MQFYEVNIYYAIIFRIHTIYNKHEIIKIGNQTKKNREYYRKYSNNFADDSTRLLRDGGKIVLIQDCGCRRPSFTADKFK